MMGQDQLCQKFRKRHHLGPRYDFFTKKSVICYGPDSQSYMYNVHTVKDMDKENKDNKVSTWKQFLPEKYLQLLWECLEKA